MVENMTVEELEKIRTVLIDSRWYWDYGGYTSPIRSRCSSCGEDMKDHEDCEADEALAIIERELEKAEK